jgi:hypothetical protein
MNIYRFTAPTLSECRHAIALKALPRPVVLWRVFDSLDIAICALSSIAECKRKTAIARYADPSASRLCFVLVYKTH